MVRLLPLQRAHSLGYLSILSIKYHINDTRILLLQLLQNINYTTHQYRPTFLSANTENERSKVDNPLDATRHR